MVLSIDPTAFVFWKKKKKKSSMSLCVSHAQFFQFLSITLACSSCVLRKGIKDSHSFPQDLAGSLVSFVFLSTFLLPFFLTPSPLLQLCQRNCFDLFLHGPGCHECSLMMLSEALSGVWTIADLDQEPTYSPGCSHHGYTKARLGSTRSGPQPTRPPQPPPNHPPLSELLRPPRGLHVLSSVSYWLADNRILHTPTCNKCVRILYRTPSNICHVHTSIQIQ